MALHWRPVGPETAQTYWRRRALVALAPVALVVLLLWLLRSLFGGDDERLAQRTLTVVGTSPGISGAASPAPAMGPSASAGPSGPAASASPSAAQVDCADAALRLEAAAAAPSYPVGASPELQLTVTNTGAVACRRDLGQAAVELLVVSGPDRIWSSDDCAPGGGSDLTTLQPGASEVSRVTWSGQRSAPGCSGDEARALAGTYRVTARVGALRTDGQQFVLR